MAEDTSQSTAVNLLLGMLWGTVATASLVGVALARARRQPGGVDGWLSRAHLPAFVSVAIGNDGTEAAAAYAGVRREIAAARTALGAGGNARTELASAQRELQVAEGLRSKVSGPPALVAYLSDDAQSTRLHLLKLERDVAAPPRSGPPTPRLPPPPGVPTR